MRKLIKLLGFSLLVTLVMAGGCAKQVAPTASNSKTSAKHAELSKSRSNNTSARQIEEGDAALEAEDGATTIESKVSSVTVYSDRARVSRKGSSNLGEAQQIFALRHLPAWVDDGSVRVSVDRGRIADVRVSRNFLARSTDKTWLKAEAEHVEVESRYLAIVDEISILEAQKRQIESIQNFSKEQLGMQATVTGKFSVASYGELLRFVGNELRANAKASRALSRKSKMVEPEYRASEKRLSELKNLMKLEETTVYVVMDAAPQTKAEITVTYMLPGATWEPVHELRASTDNAAEIEMLSFAKLSQTSGEDWGQADIFFSTQSSTETANIPVLDSLVLGETHHTRTSMSQKLSSYTRAQQAFTAQNELWNSYHSRAKSMRERSSFEQAYKSNVEVLRTVQSKTVKLFETLKKRGTTEHFRAAIAPSVRGDGKSVRMRIGKSLMSAKQKIIAVPEQSLNAVRTLQLANTSGQAILPGKVSLYQDGAFLGLTDVDFIARDEDFALYLSLADHLKLSRVLDKKKSSLVRKKRNRMQISYLVTVENLSGQETTLMLADRVPVSENKDIRVERVLVEPFGKADSKGILRWNLKLGPKQNRTFRISYQLEYPSLLVLEANRKRRRRTKQQLNISSPYNNYQDYKIEDQLYDLEQQF